MIRAPNSLVVVRPDVVLQHVVRPLGKESIGASHEEQQKSPSYGDMKAIQCKMARTALAWGVLDLAKAASVSTQTIVRLERGEDLREATIERIINAFEEAGIEFIPENGGGVGVRFRKAT
jgi:DNA-binding XRE family transcriptional regulator